jgi:hypothetical protein
MTYPAEPVHTPLGARLRERTQPLADDDARYGFAHAYLCESLATPFLEVQQIFDPEGDVPPVAPLLDPDLCPAFALPWLAQLTGMTLPAGTPENAARELIRNVGGFRRGTRRSIQAAVGAYLTGSKTVYFRERDAGDAYRLEVVTIASETPDPAAIQRALELSVPGGIVVSYRTTAAWDYQQMTTEGGTYAQQSAAYATYSTLREHDPI